MKSLETNSNFLLQRFENEWKEIQKLERRRGRSEKFKAGGRVIGKTLLGLLAMGGVFTIMMVAPKVFVLFDAGKQRRMFMGEDDFHKNRQNFKKRRLIEFKRKDDSTFEIFVTEKGKKRALGDMYQGLDVKKPVKWDGLWRIVIFDIPERKKVERDGFRWKLNQMGFYRLQDSVFVMPYSCEEEIDFLVSVFNIGAYVRFFKTLSLNSDLDLKKYFNL